MYLNDLATGIKNLNCGIDMHGYNLAILLYADDIVLIAPTEEALQEMLSHVNSWCKKWRMAANYDKTQIVHFRRRSSTQSQFKFHLGNASLNTVNFYKYLGVIFDEHLTFDQNSSTLADAAGRSKLKNLKNCGFNTFNTLFNSCVLSIADYSAAIWGTKHFPKTEQIQYKGARYFLGVHQFASTNALLGDMGWLSARHKTLILKFWNHLCEMSETRLTRKVFEWGFSYKYKRGTWGQVYQPLTMVS